MWELLMVSRKIRRELKSESKYFHCGNEWYWRETKSFICTKAIVLVYVYDWIKIIKLKNSL